MVLLPGEEEKNHAQVLRLQFKSCQEGEAPCPCAIGNLLCSVVEAVLDLHVQQPRNVDQVAEKHLPCFLRPFLELRCSPHYVLLEQAVHGVKRSRVVVLAREGASRCVLVKRAMNNEMWPPQGFCDVAGGQSAEAKSVTVSLTDERATLHSGGMAERGLTNISKHAHVSPLHRRT